MPIHKQVQIEYNGKIIEVDDGISNLLWRIWLEGHNTIGSCEECEPGFALIEFEYAHDLMDLLNLIGSRFENENDELYQRIMQTSHSDDNWKYEIHPRNTATKTNIKDPDTGEKGVHIDYNFLFSVSVKFPKYDIFNLEESLEGFQIGNDFEEDDLDED